MKLLFLFFISWMGVVQATTSVDVFRKFLNPYFIETGTYQGDGIQNALSAGFQTIYSVELSSHHFECSAARFRGQENVHLFQGDSGELLSEILKQIDAPATFWIDSHYSSGSTARGRTNTPILAELEAIKKHPIKDHTILIDDVRLFGTIEFDFIELDEIVQKILEINPQYQITFEDGVFARDVLAAYVTR